MEEVRLTSRPNVSNSSLTSFKETENIDNLKLDTRHSEKQISSVNSEGSRNQTGNIEQRNLTPILWEQRQIGTYNLRHLRG